MSVLQRASVRPKTELTLGRYLRSLDWVLLFSTLGLVTFGMVMIYSATHGDPGLPSPTFYVRSQAMGLGLGLVAVFGLSLVDFSWFSRWRTFIYWGIVVLLAVTLFVGAERMGARRWLALPLLPDLQTSELAKIAIIVAFAGFLSDGVALRGKFRFVILAAAYVALPAGLVFLEPDLGTALVFSFLLVTMLLVWGARWSHLAVLIASGVLAVVAVLRILPATLGVNLLKPYQIQRLLVFLDPGADTSGAAYQLSQSKIAVASGMFAGKGYARGTQTMLNFLPAHHTDFIFSVIAEELGFLGAALLLGLYLVVLWRALRIASISKSLYGTLIAVGIAGVLLFQVFVNVGMTIGIMPVTGVPLPFVSFGSSSLVVFLIAVGLLQSIHVHSRLTPVTGRFKGESHGQMAT